MLTRGCCTLHITGNCITAGAYICHVQIYIHMVKVLKIKKNNKNFEYTFTYFFSALNLELVKTKQCFFKH